MSYSYFQGMENIIEVECSGKDLSPNNDLLALSIYTPNDDRVVASANLKTNECITSQSFSLCVLQDRIQGTKVKTLVLDLGENEAKLYGCNVTTTASGRPNIYSYSVIVKKQSKSGFPWYHCSLV